MLRFGVARCLHSYLTRKSRLSAGFPDQGSSVSAAKPTTVRFLSESFPTCDKPEDFRPVGNFHFEGHGRDSSTSSHSRYSLAVDVEDSIANRSASTVDNNFAPLCELQNLSPSPRLGQLDPACLQTVPEAGPAQWSLMKIQALSDGVSSVTTSCPPFGSGPGLNEPTFPPAASLQPANLGHFFGFPSEISDDPCAQNSAASFAAGIPHVPA